MTKFILIIFLSVSNTSYAGTGGISHEFRSKESCEYAGKSITAQAIKRGNYVLTWGCFPT